jgi:hypothetical protein
LLSLGSDWLLVSPRQTKTVSPLGHFLGSFWRSKNQTTFQVSGAFHFWIKKNQMQWINLFCRLDFNGSLAQLGISPKSATNG